MSDQRLKRAIRAFTVDAGTLEVPRPNGPAEVAWLQLGEALRALPDPAGKRIASLAIGYLEADGERLQELRQAADEFFREDFRHPEPLDLRGGLPLSGTRDADLRRALHARLKGEQPEWALVLDEFGLNHGAIRVDVAVLNGLLHGYELKSDRDTLDRLPRQVSAYSAVLDFATLVAAPRHLTRARALVPEWWGLLEAVEEDGAVRLAQWRESRRNPGVDALSRARLLWRTEVLELLAQVGAARGWRGRPRAELYERLVCVLGRDVLLAQVLETVRQRRDWR